MSYDSDDNSDDYDVPPFDPTGMDESTWRIVMGRPVEPNAMELAIGVQEGLDFSDPYDGSIKKPCKQCMRECWIGPRQQEMMNATECIVMCPSCSVENMHKMGINMDNVHSLGNTHPRGN